MIVVYFLLYIINNYIFYHNNKVAEKRALQNYSFDLFPSFGVC
jgi:hypothetical protein